MTVDASDRRRSSMRLVVLGVLAVVVLGIVVGLFWGWNKNRPTPEKAIQNYLEAVKAGRASDALSYADATVDRTFLTDEMLQKLQSRGWGLSTISKVHGSKATFSVAGQERSVAYPVQESKGIFSFPVSVPVDIRTVVPVTLEGKPVAGRVDLFPGRYEVRAVSPNNTMEGGFIAADPLAPPVVSPEIKLTEQGANAAKEAAQADLLRCVSAKQLGPKGCPFRLKQPANGIIDDSTISYTLAEPDPLKSVVFEWDKRSARAAADVALTIDFKGDGKMKDGSGSGAVQQRLAISTRVYVNVTEEKPTVTWSIG